MSKFVVIDQDNFEYGLPRELDTEDIVDRMGYIDPQTLIQQMIASGDMLNNVRQDDYDIQGDGIVMEDPTRNQDFDIIDAYKMQSEVKRRIRSDIDNEKKRKEKENLETENETESVDEGVKK